MADFLFRVLVLCMLALGHTVIVYWDMEIDLYVLSAVEKVYFTQIILLDTKINKLLTYRQPPPCPDPSSPGEGAGALASFLQ